MALQILYPNGEVMACQMYIWDVNTLSPVVWDGSLTTGAITIGTVDQGLPGATPWLVSLSGASAVSVNNAAGASAVNIQDGGNSITVDGSVSISGSVTLGASSAAIGHVIIDSGSVSATISGNVTVVQPTGTSLHTVIDSGTITTVSTVTSVTTVGTITNPVTVTQSTASNLKTQANPYRSTTGTIIAAAQTLQVDATGSSIVQVSAITTADINDTYDVQTSYDSGATWFTIITGVAWPIIGTPATFATYSQAQALFRVVGNTVITGGSLLLQAQGITSFTDTKISSVVDGLTQININTAGQIAPGAGSYVRQDSTATIAKESGGNLATIVTNTNPLKTAQGATGTSVVGPMVQGLVSDSPSSYLDNQIRPLSLTSDGRLRVLSIDREDLDFFGDLNPYGPVNNFGLLKQIEGISPWDNIL